MEAALVGSRFVGNAMRIISEAIRLIQDAQARKRNEERGRIDLQRREVEALEQIARNTRKSQHTIGFRT